MCSHIDFNELKIKKVVPRRDSIPKARYIIFFDEVTQDIRTYFLASQSNKLLKLMTHGVLLNLKLSGNTKNLDLVRNKLLGL
jgi:hypothetical protein